MLFIFFLYIRQKSLSFKDKIFEYFVQHGTFEGAGNPKATDLKRSNQDLIIELSSLILIGLPSIYFLIQFLLYGSLFAKIIFVGIVMIGNCTIFHLNMRKIVRKF